jgi:hypothetical protein
MTTSPNLIWHQADRDTPSEQERRSILQAEAAVKALWAIYDAELASLQQRAPKMFSRILGQLSTALNQAQTLLEAYDYYQVRCAEAGISPEDAAAAWDTHSSDAFEADIIEAESYGPNAMRMIDETILARLRIPPYSVADGAADVTG